MLLNMQTGPKKAVINLVPLSSLLILTLSRDHATCLGLISSTTIYPLRFGPQYFQPHKTSHSQPALHTSASSLSLMHPNISSSLYSNCEVKQSIYHCQLLDHLYHVIINVLQKSPGLLLPCYVVPPEIPGW